MSALLNVESMKWGKHASVTSVADPASDYYLTPRNEVYAKYLKETIDRGSVQLPTGTVAANKAGIDTLSLPEMQFELYGLEGGGTDDAEAASAVDCELDDWLELICGATAVGTGNTVASAASATVTMDNTAAGAARGTAMLFTLDSGDKICREITGSSGFNYTLESAAINKDGTSGTYTAASTLAKASRTFLVDPLAPNRIPMGGDLQGELERYRYQGVTADGGIVMPEGEIAYLAITNAMASQVDRETSLATITYAARSRGNAICVDDGIFWIGTTPYYFYGASWNAGNTLIDRKNTAAKNNVSGRAYGRAAPTLTVSLPLGELTGPAQTVESVLNDFRNMTEYNVAVQCGAAGGETLYIRQPVSVAHLGDVVSDGGVKVATVTFTGLDTTDETTAYGAYPARVHLL